MKKILSNIFEKMFDFIVITTFILIGILYIIYMGIRHPKDTFNGLKGLKK